MWVEMFIIEELGLMKNYFLDILIKVISLRSEFRNLALSVVKVRGLKIGNFCKSTFQTLLY